MVGSLQGGYTTYENRNHDHDAEASVDHADGFRKSQLVIYFRLFEGFEHPNQQREKAAGMKEKAIQILGRLKSMAKKAIIAAKSKL